MESEGRQCLGRALSAGIQETMPRFLISSRASMQRLFEQAVEAAKRADSVCQLESRQCLGTERGHPGHNAPAPGLDMPRLFESLFEQAVEAARRADCVLDGVPAFLGEGRGAESP